MYLYETHFHTKEISPCAKVPAKTGVSMYKDAGYSGVLVTDHFATEYLLRNYKGNSWRDKIDYYLEGYRTAKKYETNDFSVMLGIELRFIDNENDYIIFGIDEKFLYSNEWFTNLTVKEFKPIADKNGLTVIQAHPFRRKMVIIDPRYITGVEVYNGNRRYEPSYEIASVWAKTHNLYATSGSDFHQPEDLARGGIFLNNPVKTQKEFRKAILSDDYKLKLPVH